MIKGSSKIQLVFIFLLALAPALFSQNFSQSSFQSATFGPSREFWPLSKASSKDSSLNNPKVAVLPLSLTKLEESKPCDSCHWISKNGVEFVLENSLVELCREMESPERCEWVPPHHDLIKGGKIKLLEKLNQLNIPWERYFSDYGYPLIHREKDKLTSAKTKDKLSKLAGTLNAQFILLGQKLEMKVSPISSNSHTGNYQFQFYLMLWEVLESRPLWALKTNIESNSTDLDKPFGNILRQEIIAQLKSLPAQLHAYLKAEPK